MAKTTDSALFTPDGYEGVPPELLKQLEQYRTEEVVIGFEGVYGTLALSKADRDRLEALLAPFINDAKFKPIRATAPAATKPAKASTTPATPSYDKVELRRWADKHIADGNELGLPEAKTESKLWADHKTRFPDKIVDGFLASRKGKP